MRRGTGDSAHRCTEAWDFPVRTCHSQDVLVAPQSVGPNPCAHRHRYRRGATTMNGRTGRGHLETDEGGHRGRSAGLPVLADCGSRGRSAGSGAPDSHGLRDTRRLQRSLGGPSLRAVGRQGDVFPRSERQLRDGIDQLAPYRAAPRSSTGTRPTRLAGLSMGAASGYHRTPPRSRGPFACRWARTLFGYS